MELSHQHLKARQREIRDDFPAPLALRTHRALSWLQRAEQEDQDADARFIFLWIAFNAAYANEIHDRTQFSERRILLNFLHRLIDVDSEKLLYKAVWDEFPKSIRLLIDNRYVFQPFWNHQNGLISETQWQESFKKSKASINRAMGQMDTKKILAVVFDRLYVLRNQLIHGGATWNSSVNRNQIRNGACIMGQLVPTIIHLMMENSSGLWGEPSFPVVA